MQKGKKIVIIGAGPAGLTAGIELLKKGFQVSIFEKDTEYVGGISRTVKYKDYRFDIGGHRFFTKNHEIENWWLNIMGEDLLKRPRISRWFYKKKYFSYPINIFEIISKFGGFFAVKIIFSLIFRKLFPIDPEENLDSWFRNNFGDFLAKPFFINYNYKLWGIPCEHLSMDFAEQRIKGVSIKNTIIESLKKLLHLKGSVKSFVQEFYYPKFGPGELWERVADLIIGNGGELFLNHEVISFKASKDKIKSIIVKVGDKKKIITGDYFLSTIPYKELALNITPRLEREVIQAANNLKFRAFVTVALIVKKEFLTKDTWIYTHDEDMKPIRFQNFNNWSPFMSPCKKISVIGLEYTCDLNDNFWNKTDEELKTQGKKDFLKMGFASKEEIIDSAIVRMQDVYPVYDIGYSERVKVIRNSLQIYKNLFAFGRGGIHRYNNSDHSMMTAFLTVKNIEKGEKAFDVFKVNNDAEYHEE